MNASSPELPPDVNAETRSRLSPIVRDKLDEAQKQIYDALSQRNALNLAGLRGPGGIWLRVPSLGGPLGELNRALRAQSGLDPLLVEVAILATAREMGSDFEWVMHEPVARTLGLPESTLEALRLRADLGDAPPAHAALAALAREAVGASRVSTRTYARAAALFGEAALIKFSALIGSYAMTAIMLRVFGQELPEGQVRRLPG